MTLTSLVTLTFDLRSLKKLSNPGRVVDICAKKEVDPTFIFLVLRGLTHRINDTHSIDNQSHTRLHWFHDIGDSDVRLPSSYRKKVNIGIQTAKFTISKPKILRQWLKFIHHFKHFYLYTNLIYLLRKYYNKLNFWCHVSVCYTVPSVNLKWRLWLKWLQIVNLVWSFLPRYHVHCLIGEDIMELYMFGEPSTLLNTYN